MRIQPVLSVTLALAIAGIVYSQAPSSGNPGQQGRTQIDVNVLQVPLMVSVTDNKGKLVTSLTKEDFKVYEDDKLQAIGSFNRDADLPLSIALLVDGSGSIIQQLKFERAAATEFFFNTIKRRKDRAIVIGFDSTVSVLSDESVQML
jgi:VWFA-related protein